MPIYEYACQRCDHRLDALQKMSDEPLVDCPACGAPELKRLISAPRFRLKGGGWYETDFKKDNQRNVLKSDSESSDSGKKSDKKPEKKADTTSGSGSGGKPAAKSDS